MPKIYSPEKRVEIRERLLSLAKDVIRHEGYGALRIEALTKAANIAQGTFYHFYPSKEALLLLWVERYQSQLNGEVEGRIRQQGGLYPEDIRRYYLNMLLWDEESVYRYLKRDDMQRLLSRAEAHNKDVVQIGQAAVATSLKNCIGLRVDCDPAVAYNLIQLMHLAVENQDILSPAALEETLQVLVDALIAQVFESPEPCVEGEVRS